MEVVPPQDSIDELCSSVLFQFSNSTNEYKLQICTAISAMSQELKHQNLPRTPIAYFGATLSSLDRLSSSSDPPRYLLDALITILSLVIDEFNPSILKTKYDYLSELLIRVLRLKSIGANGIEPAMKCVSRLLIVREKVGWADVAQLYGVLLGYITDDRPKVAINLPSPFLFIGSLNLFSCTLIAFILSLGGEKQIRKQSHSCLREVLLNFQISPVLAPLLANASEAVANVFERFHFLDGGSNAKASGVPKGALKFLYVLDALKFCLPYMSAKSSSNILKSFKSLLEMREPLVTRRITDALNALCLHSFGEVSAEIILDLLCSLITSLSANESSADCMTFTACLLDSGMKKVYSINRQICLVKLPGVFSALKDILISEHEEAMVAAMATFKSLVHACIDENLIKQGVDEITMNSNATSRKSCPTVIEKVCATIESLLDYHYASVWDVSFQIVSSMFEKLGIYSIYFLKGTLESLAELQKLPDEDFPFRKQLHECVGAALGAMGPEAFLNILPLKLEAQNLSEANLWLFPILKRYVVGANLSFFTKSILPVVSVMKQKSAMEEGIYSAETVGIVYSLWSLLPSFCNYPVDTAESFKDLEKALCSALREEHDVHGIICSSLQILIQQNKKILEGKVDISNVEISIPEERASALYASQVVEANLRVLRSSARELFHVLFDVFMKSSEDIVGLLQNTIGELASISDKEVVTRIFNHTIKNLLKVTQVAVPSGTSRNSNVMQVDISSGEGSLAKTKAQLLDLAVSLLPGLDAKEIDILVVPIQRGLKDIEGLIQKKAYKALSMIFGHSDGFISRRLEEMLSLMVEVLPSCHFSAKRHRLDCLYFLIIHVSKDGSEQRRHDITASFLTEIILALKEANKKTRDRACDILVEIGRAYGDEESGKRENLYQFFNMVAGGLAGETPHMISASMEVLTHLAYEFSDLVSALYNVLPSVYLLLQRKNREIIKANLGLLEVLVAKSHAEALQKHLQSMVKGLLNWQDSTENHFKAKVKLLLEMLVRKCGLDAVKEVMPAEHAKLLTNIRKLEERKERLQVAKSVDTISIQSKATTSRMSRWKHSQIFSNFADGESQTSDDEYMDAKRNSGWHSKYSPDFQSQASSLRSRRTRKAAQSLQEDLFDQLDDEPLDLLDQKKTKFSLRSSELIKQKSDSSDQPEIDSEGRLIIHEEGREKKGGRTRKREMTIDTEVGKIRSHLSENSRKVQKRRKTSESGWAYTGSEYASKKAGGDVNRKDKLEPYAYWPLDRKMMSRRQEHRAAARKGMASIVKLTKKIEGRSVSKALLMKRVALKNGTRKGNQKKR
ncbi:ARM repeat superfamily protein [Abeliophyllum distichum]|uniref:ARM repeat superfamily protein n=1 Tax=Abeliophyllum distichum TaxID=126358 RepID=A0ABD1Q4Q3_9LAMI